MLGGLQSAYLAIQGESCDEARIEGLSVDLEVMKDPNDIDQIKELSRWIVKLDMSTVINNMTYLTFLPPITTMPRLEGRMRGGAVVSLYLDSTLFAYANWKLVHEEVKGINDEGSLQCSWLQSWVGTTEWVTPEWSD